jgi:hypothetical protein
VQWVDTCYLFIILPLPSLLFCSCSGTSVKPFSYFCNNGKHRRDIRRKRALSHGDLHFEGEEILLLIAQRGALPAVRVGACVTAMVGIRMSCVVRNVSWRAVLCVCLPAHISCVVCAERTVISVLVFPNCRLLAPRVTWSAQKYKRFEGCIPYRPKRATCTIVCVYTEGLHTDMWMEIIHRLLNKIYTKCCRNVCYNLAESWGRSFHITSHMNIKR